MRARGLTFIHHSAFIICSRIHHSSFRIHHWKFIVVIPARYGSSRFPGKPIAALAGKPMVVRVAERAAKSGAAQVIVATDHAGIASAAKPVMTSR